MAIIYHYVWFLKLVPRNPNPVEPRLDAAVSPGCMSRKIWPYGIAYAVYLFPVNRGEEAAIPPHAETEKGQDDVSGEEDPCHARRDFCKGILHASDHGLLE